MIHLLALRPYKKPEIFARIQQGKFRYLGNSSSTHSPGLCPFIDACIVLSSSNNISVAATDGVRREERKCITQILTNISSMRDNVYYLHRHIWNDVQEDWPFYSEQERQILKRSFPRISIFQRLLLTVPLSCFFSANRRKPQNLTPPLSSDGGSSTSGQSPSSTHNGSSPPSGGKRSSIANNEEPGVGSAPTSKKPRISHYKKEALPDTNR